MTPRRAITIAALVAYGWWATSLQPFSTAATIAVVGAGVIAIAWGATRRRRRDRTVVRRGLTGWLLLAVILGGWQLAAYVDEPRSEHPTLSSLTNGALDTHLAQAFACAAWLIAAAALARR